MPLNRRYVTLLVFFSIMVVVCASFAFLSVRFFTPDYGIHDGPEGHEGHDWVHRQLGRINAFEKPYRTERARLQTEFDTRVRALANLLESQDDFSPAVTAAVADLHHYHGQLQQLAIAHYFEMLSVLPPDKQNNLRKIATDALSTPQ